MNRSCAVLALLMLAFCAPAAAEWIKVFEGAERAYYIDLATVQRDASRSRVWTLMDLKKPTGRGAMSRVALQELDCTGGQDRVLSIAEYSWPGANGTLFFRDNTERAWRATSAGTVNERIGAYVCRLVA